MSVPSLVVILLMECCPLGGLAVEAETSVCLAAAVSAAAGKLSAAAMPPPAINTLRREARAGIGSFNRESSWLGRVGSSSSMPGALSVPDQTTQIFPATLLRAVGTEKGLMRIGDERLGCGANPRRPALLR